VTPKVFIAVYYEMHLKYSQEMDVKKKN